MISPPFLLPCHIPQLSHSTFPTKSESKLKLLESWRWRDLLMDPVQHFPKMSSTDHLFHRVLRAISGTVWVSWGVQCPFAY